MVRSVLQWLADNKESVFSGAGVVVVGAVWRRFSRRAPSAREPLPTTQWFRVRATFRLVVTSTSLSRTSAMLDGSSVPRFRFNADEVPDLMNKVQILEGHGFLRDVTPKTAPVFRMMEEFVALLVRARTVPA